MLDEIKTFVILAEEGSIQKVADKLPLTQPAVSRQIQRLEQMLDIVLLDRRQKPPVLTQAGQQILIQCRQLLTSFEAMKNVSRHKEPEGVFRIGLTNGLANGNMAELLHHVLKPYPKVQMQLKTGWSHALAEQHRLGLLDIAIILTDEPHFYEAEDIGKETLSIITSSDSGKKDDFNRQWVVSPEPCDARRKLIATLASINRKMSIAAEVEDAGLQLALIRQGLGYGLAPTRLLESHNLSGIKEITLFTHPIQLDIKLLRSPYLGNFTNLTNNLAHELKQHFRNP